MKNKGNVFKTAQDRPLMSVYETRVKKSKIGANTTTKGPHSTFPHSKNSEERSERYHATIVGTPKRVSTSTK